MREPLASTVPPSTWPVSVWGGLAFALIPRWASLPSDCQTPWAVPALGGWWQCGCSPGTDRGLSALFQGRSEAHGLDQRIPATSCICSSSPPPSLRTGGPWSEACTGSALFCSLRCLPDPGRVWTLLKTRLSTRIIPCPPPESWGAARVCSPFDEEAGGGPGELPGEAGVCRWRQARGFAPGLPACAPRPTSFHLPCGSVGVSMPLTQACLSVPPEERRAREWPLDVAELPEVCLEDWLEKRAKRLSSAPSSRYRPRGPPSVPSRSRTPASSPLSPPTAQGPDMDAHIGLRRGPTSGLSVPRPWPEADGHSLVGSRAQPWWLSPYSSLHRLKVGRCPSQLESTSPGIPSQREGPDHGHCPL